MHCLVCRTKGSVRFSRHLKRCHLYSLEYGNRVARALHRPVSCPAWPSARAVSPPQPCPITSQPLTSPMPPAQHSGRLASPLLASPLLASPLLASALLSSFKRLACSHVSWHVRCSARIIARLLFGKSSYLARDERC